MSVYEPREQIHKDKVYLPLPRWMATCKENDLTEHAHKIPIFDPRGLFGNTHH